MRMSFNVGVSAVKKIQQNMAKINHWFLEISEGVPDQKYLAVTYL